MTNEDNEEIDFTKLVRADQALDWLTPILGSRTLAKAEIADLMRDGLIEVYARRACNSRTLDPTLAWQLGLDESDDFTDLETEISVLPSVWRRSRQWLLDQMDWRWPSGRFSVIHNLKPIHRILIEHVHFEPDEIRQVAGQRSGRQNHETLPLPLAGHWEAAPVEKPDDTLFEGNAMPGKRRGRHSRGEAWAAVCNELWRLRETGELQNGSFNGPQNLAHHCSRITKKPAGSEGLQQGTIEPLISALVKSGFMPDQSTK